MLFYVDIFYSNRKLKCNLSVWASSSLNRGFAWCNQVLALHKPSEIVQTCNPSVRKIEAGRLGIQSHSLGYIASSRSPRAT